jgi:hypothetical protein
MLRAYCYEFRKDWEKWVPLVLFAVRKVVQESLDFSPNKRSFELAEREVAAGQHLS